jgi:predicted metal-dependent phosphoesterase TrpH
VRADLHVHSNASDGIDSPSDVMRRASTAGLDVIALTDHDTTAGIAQARDNLPEGLTLIQGMELSCHLNDRSVHLLAYLFDEADEDLQTQTQRIREDRVIRAQAMVGILQDLGAPVTWEDVAKMAGSAVVGRPHIARAMVAAGVINAPEEAFTDEWIADGGRAYVDKYALDPAHAIRLIRSAGGTTVLAHPRAGRAWNLSDEEIAALARAGLAGLEVFHPDHDEAARQRLLDLAVGLGLIPTGGSDDHGALNGNRIGEETTGDTAYERLLQTVTRAR